MSTVQIFPNLGLAGGGGEGGVIKSLIFPKFKEVHIYLRGGGSKKIWTSPLYVTILFFEGFPYVFIFIVFDREDGPADHLVPGAGQHLQQHHLQLP